MTHPQQTTREVIEQLVDALDHCMGAITERGLNGSPDQAEKWGLQLPLERAYAALAAGQQALEQTQVVEIDTSQERVDKTAGNGDMVPLSAIRPIAVEAIRAVTGCPDIRGNDKYLVDEIEDIAKHAALLQSTAHHIGDANKMVAALPVGELTVPSIATPAV